MVHTALGICGAAVIVFSTSVSNFVWLIPFVSSPNLPRKTKAVNGIVFIVTNVLISIGCVVVAELCMEALEYGVVTDKTIWGEEYIVFQTAAAVLCWTIFFIMIGLKIYRRRQRRQGIEKLTMRQKRQQQLQNYGAVAPVNGMSPNGASPSEVESGENEQLEDDGQENNGDESGDDAAVASPPPLEKEESWLPKFAIYDSRASDAISKAPSVVSVAGLSTLGMLDEVAYFPVLVLGQIFTPFQLVFGTLIASCKIVAIITTMLARATPVLEYLEKLPLFVVVGCFAVSMTIMVVIDVITGTAMGSGKLHIDDASSAP